MSLDRMAVPASARPYERHRLDEMRLKGASFKKIAD